MTTNSYYLRGIVYHGTTSDNLESLLNKIDLTKCDRETDFGYGFYATIDFVQARKWACFKANYENRVIEREIQSKGKSSIDFVRPIVLEYKLNLQEINRLKKYEFIKVDDNWKKFIYNNRNNGNLRCHAKNNLEPSYDVVVGPMADSKVATKIELVRAEQITEEEFIEQLTPHGCQVSFHTDRVIKHLSLTGVIHYEEIKKSNKDERI